MIDKAIDKAIGQMPSAVGCALDAVAGVARLSIEDRTGRAHAVVAESAIMVPTVLFARVIAGPAARFAG